MSLACCSLHANIGIFLAAVYKHWTGGQPVATTSRVETNDFACKVICATEVGPVVNKVPVVPNTHMHNRALVELKCL